MFTVAKIINDIKNVSSANEKLQILQQHQDNFLLKKTLEYTYNPFKKYGLSDKTLKPIENDFEFGMSIFDLLDMLEQSNINDDLRQQANMYLGRYKEHKELFELYRGMILKDLGAGISTKTINKVWKYLIPEFSVQLAESYFKQKSGFLNYREFIITTKLDGNRLVVIKERGEVKCYSRQGKPITGLVDIEKLCDKLDDNMVYDGELIAENPTGLTSEELYRKTTSILRTKGDKTGVIFHCFDCLPLINFKHGKDETPFKQRKANLKEIIDRVDSKYFVEVPILYQGNDENQIYKWIAWARENHLEGIMINLASAPYECKRNKNILKGKIMQTCDLKVVGYEIGTGSLRYTLGALEVEYKGNIVKVGSGYSLEQRKQIWEDRDNMIGKIIEVQYFEETQDSKTLKYSLRFPVFKQIREDKTRPSYH